MQDKNLGGRAETKDKEVVANIKRLFKWLFRVPEEKLKVSDKCEVILTKGGKFND